MRGVDPVSLAELLAAVNRWGEEAVGLAGELALACGPLRAGVPLPAALRARLTAHGERFAALAARAADLGPERSAIPADLEGLRDAISAALAAERRTRARDVLERARRIRPLDPSDPVAPDLAAVEAMAARLLATLPQAAVGEGDEVPRLADGTHPLALLVALADQTVSDDAAAWWQALSAVCAAFGAPLARAADRRRLAVAEGAAAAEPAAAGGAGAPPSVPAAAGGSPARAQAGPVPASATGLSLPRAAPAVGGPLGEAPAYGPGVGSGRGVRSSPDARVAAPAVAGGVGLAPPRARWEPDPLAVLRGRGGIVPAPPLSGGAVPAPLPVTVDWPPAGHGGAPQAPRGTAAERARRGDDGAPAAEGRAPTGPSAGGPHPSPQRGEHAQDSLRGVEGGPPAGRSAQGDSAASECAGRGDDAAPAAAVSTSAAAGDGHPVADRSGHRGEGPMPAERGLPAGPFGLAGGGGLAVVPADGRRVAAGTVPAAPAAAEAVGRWVARAWDLLRSGRAGAAHHLLRAVWTLAPAGAPLLPHPALARAVALAPFVRRRDGEVAAAFAPLDVALPEDLAVHLLAWAGAARPALVAPTTGAAGLLERLRWGTGFEALYELTRMLADVASRCGGLTPAVIGGVQSRATWQAELDEARRAVVAWAAQAPEKGFVYAPAGAVWKAWVAPGGPVAAMVAPVLAGRLAAVEEVRGRRAELADNGRLRRLREETERAIGQRRPIEARALRQLHQGRDEAVELAARWLAVASRPPLEPDYVRERVHALKACLDRLGEPAREELERAARPGGPAAAAVACARRALDNLIGLFAGGLASGDALAEPDPHHLLGADLLLWPDLDMGGEWEPRGEPVAVARTLGEGVPCAGLAEAFGPRVERRDLQGAARVVQLLSRDGHPRAAELEQQWQRRLREHQAWLAGRLADVQERVEAALIDGLLDEDARDRHLGRLLAYEAQTPRLRRFHEADADLQALTAELAGLRAARQEDLRQALAAVSPPPDPATGARIAEAIARGDTVAAQEYLDRVRAGEALPEADPEGPEAAACDAFFPHALRALEELLRAPDAYARARAALHAGRAATGAAPARLTEAQRRSGLDLLDAWFALKREHVPREQPLRQVLDALGLQVQQVIPGTAGTGGDVVEVTVRTDPVADRDACSVPAFGSVADGSYRLLLVWRAASGEELVGLVGETAGLQRATLLCLFGLLDTWERRELARLCRERRRTFLLIDDALVLHLAAQPAPRLGTLVGCTLPFTYAAPYATGPGPVPVEMFYGRSAELHAVVAPSGGRCFVYGGRQLGKTALLREAARRFHDPREGCWAVWVDLKVAEVGLAQGPEQVWLTLHRALRAAGIVLERVEDPVPEIRGRVDRFLDALVGWLEREGHRRLLLLLDEADAFLEQDGRQGFAQSARLKNLMERTDGRAKVVLSGLHNVLRTTEQPNHPLAHLGEPIKVGPLLNGEWNQARALVVRPLASAGYRFASESLVVRILGRCNFYPSLIQLYCAKLLERLTESRAAPEHRAGPPFTITGDLVDRVYRERAVRDAIREKFQLTLQLDPRYELVAYLMAHTFLTEPEAAPRGLGVAEARERAREWWDQGFAAMTDHEMEVLLDEMEGLGVLRRLADARYTLRSPNVALLMGTTDDIERALLKEREAPPADPASFRARPAGNARSPRRHPLTNLQVRALRRHRHAVSVVYGVPAAGIGELHGFLKEGTDPRYFLDISGATGVESFAELLSALRRRPPGAASLAVVPPAAPWDGAWIEHALQWTGRLQSVAGSVHVVFIADPGIAWRVEPGDPGSVARTTLQPWSDTFLRHWLDDVDLPSDRDLRNLVLAATGGWPGLIVGGYERLRVRGEVDRQRWSQHLAVLAEPPDAERARDVLAQFGLEDAPGAEPWRTVAVLARLAERDGTVVPDDLQLLEMDGLPAAGLQRALRWSERLGLVEPLAAEGGWRLDAVWARALRTVR